MQLKQLYKKMQYLETEINKTSNENRIAILKEELLNCKRMLIIIQNGV